VGLLACAPHRGADEGNEVGVVSDLPPGWTEKDGAYVYEITDPSKPAALEESRGVIALNEPVRRKVMVRNLSSQTIGPASGESPVPSTGGGGPSGASGGDAAAGEVSVCACEPGGTVYLGSLPPGGCAVLVFKLKTDSAGEKETRLGYLGLVDFSLKGNVDAAAVGFQFSAGSGDAADPTIGACGS
jgi:hypothetical protein